MLFKTRNDTFQTMSHVQFSRFGAEQEPAFFVSFDRFGCIFNFFPDDRWGSGSRTASELLEGQGTGPAGVSPGRIHRFSMDQKLWCSWHIWVAIIISIDLIRNTHMTHMTHMTCWFACFHTSISKTLIEVYLQGRSECAKFNPVFDISMRLTLRQWNMEMYT